MVVKSLCRLSTLGPSDEAIVSWEEGVLNYRNLFIGRVDWEVVDLLHRTNPRSWQRVLPQVLIAFAE